MIDLYKDEKLNFYVPLYKNKELITELNNDKIIKIKEILNIIRERDKPKNKK